MPLFGSSKKSPQETARNLSESLNILHTADPSSKKAEKASEDVQKHLLACKTLLQGSGDQEPQLEILAQLAQEFSQNHLYGELVQNLAKLDFEARKEVVFIFGVLLRRQIGNRMMTVDYFLTSHGTETIFLLLRGYETPDVALNSGMILRECIRYEPIAKILINDKKFFVLFKYVELSTFDVASDAFSTFKDLLTRHKLIAATFLEKNYDETLQFYLVNAYVAFRRRRVLSKHADAKVQIFTRYRGLLESENYVTKRQSLKLLGELLLDRHNFVVMTKYISNPDNLKLIMNLLLDKSRNIQFEAFHVFKVFVANPNKTQPILDILLKNKEKLVEFLQNFHTDRTEDEQFNDEKTYLIKQIKELQPPAQEARASETPN